MFQSDKINDGNGYYWLLLSWPFMVII